MGNFLPSGQDEKSSSGPNRDSPKPVTNALPGENGTGAEKNSLPLSQQESEGRLQESDSEGASLDSRTGQSFTDMPIAVVVEGEEGLFSAPVPNPFSPPSTIRGAPSSEALYSVRPHPTKVTKPVKHDEKTQ